MRRACLACGLEDQGGGRPAVEMKLVEYPDPIAVQVAIPVGETHGHRGPKELLYREVPGRYGSEWRCVDVDACRRRVAELEAPAGPPDVSTVPAPFEMTPAEEEDIFA